MYRPRSNRIRPPSGVVSGFLTSNLQLLISFWHSVAFYVRLVAVQADNGEIIFGLPRSIQTRCMVDGYCVIGLRRAMVVWGNEERDLFPNSDNGLRERRRLDSAYFIHC